jgi:hypothetical protein
VTYQKNVMFVSRFANFRHLDVDETIGNALDCFNMLADLHVVMSVYDEDVTWTDAICKALSPNTTIAWFVYVKKHDRTMLESEIAPHCTCTVRMKKVIYLPNVGRESHTWATHISTATRAAKRVVFLQGGQDRYRKRNWDTLIRDAVQGRNTEPFIPLSWTKRNPSGIFVGTRKTFLLCCSDEQAANTTALARTINPDVDIHAMEHSYRGEFIVHGTSVLQVARAFDRQFRDEWIPKLAEADLSPLSYAFERLWLQMFKEARKRAAPHSVFTK